MATLSEDEWRDLALRHSNRDWNSDGYLASVIALCEDFERLISQPASPSPEFNELCSAVQDLIASYREPEGRGQFAASHSPEHKRAIRDAWHKVHVAMKPSEPSPPGSARLKSFANNPLAFLGFEVHLTTETTENAFVIRTVLRPKP